MPDPGNVQAYNRYLYALGNPIRYNDPSGNWIAQGQDGWDSTENQSCLGMVDSIYEELQSNPAWAQTWLKEQGCNKCTPDDWRNSYNSDPYRKVWQWSKQAV